MTQPSFSLEQPPSKAAPAPETRWLPDAPEVDENVGFAWTPTRVHSACAGRRLSTIVVESAADFVANFCLTPQLDWSRYRLAVFVTYDPYAQRSLRAVQVVREPDRWLVFIEPSGACCANAWDCSAPAAAILPVSHHPVVFVGRPSAMPKCDPPLDSYEY